LKQKHLNIMSCIERWTPVANGSSDLND